MDWFSLATAVLKNKKKKQNKDEENLSEIKESFEKFKSRLTPLEAVGLSCILEIASLQLYIIHVTSSSMPSLSNANVREKILKVLQETEKEIIQKGTFEVLIETTKEEIRNEERADTMEKTLSQNKILKENLKIKLTRQKSSKQDEMNNTEQIIASLKDKINEEITKTDIDLRYTERWEAAKQSQNRLQCQNAEFDLEQNLQDLNKKVENEIRVHDEICIFLNLKEKILVKEIEYWKDLYEKEMKRRKEKIKILEIRKKEQEILLHDLQQLFEEHKKEIDNYLDFKEKIHLEQEQNRRINNMAIKIQAWWRGIMVRRGLGPFKKKKKLTKEKKKK